MKQWIVVAMLIAVQAIAQPKVVSLEKLTLDRNQQWSAPRFAPDGRAVFFTTVSHDGIWEYSLVTKKSRQITADRGAGFGFAVSADGKQIAYRRTTSLPGAARRSQDVVLIDRNTRASRILGTGADVSTPMFIGGKVSWGRQSVAVETAPEPASNTIEVLGIENTKILLSRKGRTEIFDPLGNGSYIWPALSPDKNFLVAYDMTRGTFVADLDGRVQTSLGRRDHASWTRDGKWLVYMDDKDDGHDIVSSDLFCISADGRQVVQLTDTRNVIELYPQCSPTDPKIAFSTLDGGICVMEYREGAR